MPREKQAGRHAGGRTGGRADRQAECRNACSLHALPPPPPPPPPPPLLLLLLLLPCRLSAMLSCQPPALSLCVRCDDVPSIDRYSPSVCLSVCLSACVCVSSIRSSSSQTRHNPYHPCDSLHARACVLYVCDNCIYTAWQRAIMSSLCASLPPGRSQTPTDGRGCD